MAVGKTISWRVLLLCWCMCMHLHIRNGHGTFVYRRLSYISKFRQAGV